MVTTPTAPLDAYLAKLKEAGEKATKETWKSVQDEYVAFIGTQFFRVVGSETFVAGGRIQMENADFIAISRNEWSRLIGMVEELKGALETLRVAVNDKQPGPGAVMFIDRSLSKCERMLGPDKG